MVRLFSSPEYAPFRVFSGACIILATLHHHSVGFCIVLWILALNFWAVQSEACFSTAKYRLSESYVEIIFRFIFISVCVSAVWHRWTGELREAGQVAAEALSQHVQSCFTIIKIITVCAPLNMSNSFSSILQDFTPSVFVCLQFGTDEQVNCKKLDKWLLKHCPNMFSHVLQL